MFSSSGHTTFQTAAKMYRSSNISIRGASGGDFTFPPYAIRDQGGSRMSGATQRAGGLQGGASRRAHTCGRPYCRRGRGAWRAARQTPGSTPCSGCTGRPALGGSCRTRSPASPARTAGTSADTDPRPWRSLSRRHPRKSGTPPREAHGVASCEACAAAQGTVWAPQPSRTSLTSHYSPTSFCNSRY